MLTKSPLHISNSLDYITHVYPGDSKDVYIGKFYHLKYKPDGIYGGLALSHITSQFDWRINARQDNYLLTPAARSGRDKIIKVAYELTIDLDPEVLDRVFGVMEKALLDRHKELREPKTD